MKVVAITRVGSALGGAERHVEMLGVCLTRSGVEFEGVVVGATDTATMFAQSLTAKGLTATVLESESPIRLRAIVRRARPDIVHWNFPSPFAFNAGAWLHLPVGAPAVATDHLPMVRGGPRWEISRALANRWLRVLVVSSEDSRDAALRHWPRMRVAVVPNATDNVERKHRGPVRTRVLQLLMVARLEDQKDPLFALDVVKALTDAGVDVRLKIVGTGSLIAPLRTKIATTGISDHVDLLGFEDRPIRRMLEADLLITCAKVEGLPFGVIEAISTGLPVVASRIGPHEEIARRTRALVMAEPGDARDWAEKVLQAARQIEQLSANAVSNSGIYSVGAMGTAIRDVYMTVLSQTAAAA